jgi:hypothetical protein
MTIASHEAQRDAVEQWARGRGFRPLHESNGADPHVAELSDCEAPPPVALAWALLVELDAGTVDVGKCQDAPQCEDGMVDSGGETPWGYPISIHCPACNGTGRERVQIARAILDTQRDDVRACLHTEADRLLAAGDPVGLALAWGLRWSDGEGTEDGTGEAIMLLHWLTVARGQAALADFRRAHDALWLDDGEDLPATVIISPEAAARLYSEPLPMPDPIPEHVSQRARSGHARHVGDRLGRRLGVRR